MLFRPYVFMSSNPKARGYVPMNIIADGRASLRANNTYRPFHILAMCDGVTIYIYFEHPLFRLTVGGGIRRLAVAIK